MKFFDPGNIPGKLPGKMALFKSATVVLNQAMVKRLIQVVRGIAPERVA
jgi:hypothetical protein